MMIMLANFFLFKCLFFQVFSSCTHCSSREADMRQRGQSYGNLAMMTIYNCTKNTSGHSKFICLCDILVTLQVAVVQLKSYIFSYILVNEFMIYFFSLKIPAGSSTELTHQGYIFFSNLFEKYDEVRIWYLVILSLMCVA